MLTRILDFFRGGSRDFNAAEKQLLSFLMDALPPEDKGVLSRQLACVRLVQRQHPGRMVVAYYETEQHVAQLPYPAAEHCLAQVSYRSNGRTKTTSLVLHNGRFMSFERNVPQTPSDIESLVKVVLHPKEHKAEAEEIDAEKHGEHRK